MSKDYRSATISAAIVFAGISVVFGLFWLGDQVRSEFGLAHGSNHLTYVLVLALGVACFFGGISVVVKRAWNGPSRDRVGRALGVLLIGVGVVCLRAASDPNCSVDWDGRSNPTVCDEQ